MLSLNRKQENIELKKFTSSIFYFILCFGTCLADSSFFAQVTNLRGEVEIVRSGATHRATIDDNLKNGDLVQTLPGGSVELDLGDQNQILLSTSSAVHIQSQEENQKWKVRLMLTQGLIRCKLDDWNKDHIFEIKTPVAVVGVRGTDFVVDYNEGEKEEPMGVTVLRGKVDLGSNVNGIRKKKRILANQSFMVNRRGAIKKMLKQKRIRKMKLLKQRLAFSKRKAKFKKVSREQLRQKLKKRIKSKINEIKKKRKKVKKNKRKQRRNRR